MKNRIDFFEKNSIEILFAQSEHNFPLHSHESFCFGIVEEGEVTFTINGRKRVLYPGMAYIIPSNIGVIIQAKKQYRYLTICIKDEWKERLNNLKFDDYFLTFKSSDMVHKLCMNYIQNGSPAIFISKIMNLMQPVIVNEEHYQESSKSEIVEAASSYIRQNANEKFSLDCLADAIHVSKYYLVKVFKKEMGVTPNQYYIQVKMHLIKKEIMEYQKAVDLAMEYNFNDQSHLCNLFKKQMGISLLDYKKSFQRL
jgi:AraC-like DNA-binding protein